MSESARILVVDDEVQIRRALRTNLVVRGYGVLEAGDGASAVLAASDESARPRPARSRTPRSRRNRRSPRDPPPLERSRDRADRP